MKNTPQKHHRKTIDFVASQYRAYPLAWLTPMSLKAARLTACPIIIQAAEETMLYAEEQQ